MAVNLGTIGKGFGISKDVEELGQAGKETGTFAKIGGAVKSGLGLAMKPAKAAGKVALGGAQLAGGAAKGAAGMAGSALKGMSGASMLSLAAVAALVKLVTDKKSMQNLTKGMGDVMDPKAKASQHKADTNSNLNGTANQQPNSSRVTTGQTATTGNQSGQGQANSQQAGVNSTTQVPTGANTSGQTPQTGFNHQPNAAVSPTQNQGSQLGMQNGFSNSQTHNPATMTGTGSQMGREAAIDHVGNSLNNLNAAQPQIQNQLAGNKSVDTSASKGLDDQMQMGR